MEHESSNRDETHNPLNPHERGWYVHVAVPNFPLPAVDKAQDSQEAPAEDKFIEDTFGETNYLTLKDDYEFWGKSLLRHYPAFERWYRQDARDFEKGLLYRLRSLARSHDDLLKNQAQSEAKLGLVVLELCWIWEELEHRGLIKEAMAMIGNYTGVVEVIEANRIKDYGFWKNRGPLKNSLFAAVIVVFGLYFIPYCTSLIIQSSPFSNLLPGILDFFRSLSR